MRGWTGPPSAGHPWPATGSLRSVAGLVRRFGVGRDLLGLDLSAKHLRQRVPPRGGQRGRRRFASQPPDDYLPVLAQVFPGEEERLRWITAADARPLTGIIRCRARSWQRCAYYGYCARGVV